MVLSTLLLTRCYIQNGLSGIDRAAAAAPALGLLARSGLPPRWSQLVASVCGHGHCPMFGSHTCVCSNMLLVLALRARQRGIVPTAATSLAPGTRHWLAPEVRVCKVALRLGVQLVGVATFFYSSASIELSS